MYYSVKNKRFTRLAGMAVLGMLLVLLAAVSGSYAGTVTRRNVSDGATYRMNVGDTISFYNLRQPHFSAMANNLYAYNWFPSEGASELADIDRQTNAPTLMITARRAGTFTIEAYLRYTVPGTWDGYEYKDNFTVIISD